MGENDVDGQPIPGSETPDNQLAYVWENLVLAKCKEDVSVDVVAHSNGGRCLMAFLSRRDPVVAKAIKQLNKVVLTDSYHGPDQVPQLIPEAAAMLQDPAKVVNFV